MPIDMQTHGPDWKQHVRRTTIFAVHVTPAFSRNRRAQRQLAYARQLGKPIVFFVQAGTPVPPLRAGDQVEPFTTIEDLTARLRRLEAEGPA